MESIHKSVHENLIANGAAGCRVRVFSFLENCLSRIYCTHLVNKCTLPGALTNHRQIQEFLKVQDWFDGCQKQRHTYALQLIKELDKLIQLQSVQRDPRWNVDQNTIDATLDAVKGCIESLRDCWRLEEERLVNQRKELSKSKVKDPDFLIEKRESQLCSRAVEKFIGNFEVIRKLRDAQRHYCRLLRVGAVSELVAICGKGWISFWKYRDIFKVLAGGDIAHQQRMIQLTNEIRLSRNKSAHKIDGTEGDIKKFLANCDELYRFFQQYFQDQGQQKDDRQMVGSMTLASSVIFPL